MNPRLCRMAGWSDVVVLGGSKDALIIAPASRLRARRKEGNRTGA